jgi:hypothetical protein
MNPDEVIPVYLFLGFLEAGKTKFIQETIEDPKFTEDERTLLLVCEEGFEEYDLSAHPEIKLKIIDTKEQLCKETLLKTCAAIKPERILIEYNGMWDMRLLFENTPDNWLLFQTVTIIDSATFMLYNTNMRSMLAEKMAVCDLLYFNRYIPQHNAEEMHKLVRALNRRTLIYFEYTDGSIAFDNLEDPLPYDIESDSFVVHDRDFAVWFRDVSDDPEKYIGKNVTIRALVVRDDRLPKNTIAVGRQIMTCCEADIQFCCMTAHTKKMLPEKEQWAVITAKICVKKSLFQRQSFPELDIIEIQPSEPPVPLVASFY